MKTVVGEDKNHGNRARRDLRARFQFLANYAHSYLKIFDNTIFIRAATANAAMKNITLSTGPGIRLRPVFFIRSLLSNPVVYKGNRTTVT